ncbi:hypothetical protein FGO68_gene10508 [Halteria grandinella]|uniref:Uncharacterized protein n=1 Tax=Halteria grandinella TaxID=5974 RepID=A0A8J8NVM9_HALGN|nr:hypothetical protein FGO68_gene10508 [Halteria grandinella]
MIGDSMYKMQILIQSLHGSSELCQSKLALVLHRKDYSEMDQAHIQCIENSRRMKNFFTKMNFKTETVQMNSCEENGDETIEKILGLYLGKICQRSENRHVVVVFISGFDLGVKKDPMKCEESFEFRLSQYLKSFTIQSVSLYYIFETQKLDVYWSIETLSPESYLIMLPNTSPEHSKHNLESFLKLFSSNPLQINEQITIPDEQNYASLMSLKEEISLSKYLNPQLQKLIEYKRLQAQIESFQKFQNELFASVTKCAKPIILSELSDHNKDRLQNTVKNEPNIVSSLQVSSNHVENVKFRQVKFKKDFVIIRVSSNAGGDKVIVTDEDLNEIFSRQMGEKVYIEDAELMFNGTILVLNVLDKQAPVAIGRIMAYNIFTNTQLEDLYSTDVLPFPLSLRCFHNTHLLVSLGCQIRIFLYSSDLPAGKQQFSFKDLGLWYTNCGNHTHYTQLYLEVEGSIVYMHIKIDNTSWRNTNFGFKVFIVKEEQLPRGIFPDNKRYKDYPFFNEHSVIRYLSQHVGEYQEMALTSKQDVAFFVGGTTLSYVSKKDSYGFKDLKLTQFNDFQPIFRDQNLDFHIDYSTEDSFLCKLKLIRRTDYSLYVETLHCNEKLYTVIQDRGIESKIISLQYSNVKWGAHAQFSKFQEKSMYAVIKQSYPHHQYVTKIDYD